jgi:predicted phosphodiesterase
LAKVLVIPDTQIPFEHQDFLPFVKWVARREIPDIVVHLGDEVDHHALSDFDHDPDGFSAGHELREAVKRLKKWYETFPEVYVCISNHGLRPYRRAFKAGIPSAFIKSYNETLEAPTSWKWAQKWEFDGVVYEHGEGQSGQLGALKAAQGNMQSTVIGHLHSFAGIQYLANAKHLIFGFNCGCGIDKDAYAFAYGRTMKNKPVVGCGIVENGIPKFIPMPMDDRGRWRRPR